MSKKNRKLLIILVPIILVLLVSTIFIIQQTILFDDYNVYEDWTTSDLLDNCKTETRTEYCFPYDRYSHEYCQKRDNACYSSSNSCGQTSSAIFCENDKWRLFITPAGKGKPIIEGGKLVFKPNAVMIDGSGFPKLHLPQSEQTIWKEGLTSKFDFKTYDIKFSISSLDGNGQYPGCQYTSSSQSFNIGSNNILSQSTTGHTYNSGATSKTDTLNIFSSKLNANIIQAEINGIASLNTIDLGNLPYSLYFTLGETPTGYQPGQCTPNTYSISPIKFKRLFSCELQQGEALGYETFSGGREISDKSMRKTVTGYCLAHPAIIYEEGEGTTTTAEIYEKLNSGETLSIPTNQAWGIFFKFFNDGTLPSCQLDETYNFNTNSCGKIGGLVTFCTEGLFDPSTGTCQVEPQRVCLEGTYNTDLKVCQFVPPSQAICSQGTYVPSSGKCEFSPDTYANCPSGTNYNPNKNVCELFALKVIYCSALFAYDSNKDKCSFKTDLDTCTILGGSYDVDTCYKNTLLQPECKGELTQKTDGTYICKTLPEESIICRQGFDYNETLKKCIGFPEELRKSYTEIFFETLKENATTLSIITILISLISGGLLYWRLK